MSASSPEGELTAEQRDIPVESSPVDLSPAAVSPAATPLPAVSGLVFLGAEDAQVCADGTCL
ncbi:hypothetical protein [Plantactinospora soyae]|uniref:Uncharacterized protein n=1 Tax=Plantactinospora soyae TaxID=1544732 RepID=A0A927R1N9_9ACTN|nr:hypothetical protein [Plantactinospora soyae]MBE1489928.1 hypothetical protein [Plantactinospora soyae]